MRDLGTCASELSSLVNGLHAELAVSLRGGETFQMFRKRVLPRVDVGELQWPEESADVATRLELIFGTYMRTARAAGRWQRIARAADVMPYLVYLLGPSIEHRDAHVAWEGHILPVDHPFWNTHFPPNGWGCKCRTRAVTARERDRLLERAPQKYSTEAPAVSEVEWTNPATGELRRVAAGIDPGWDYNPGDLDRLAEHTKEIVGATSPVPGSGSPSFGAVERLAWHVAREAWRASPP